MTSKLPESELLSAYLDGECTPVERALVADNLGSDPEWRAALADLQLARDAVRALPPREPPSGFLEGLLVTVESDLTSAPARRPSRAFGAVAAVAAAIVGLVIATTPGRDTTPVEPQLTTLSDTHGATSSLEAEPVSNLATVAVPVTFAR